MKRALDLLLSLMLLPFVVVTIAMAAIAIWMIDGRPIVIAQEREGLNGKVFRMYKLRTMYRNADKILADALRSDPKLRAEWERYLRLDKDPRHIRYIGRSVRHTSIDEIPQIFNVIKGDMSLVGPRPFPKEFVSALDPAFRIERAKVLPGITGLWQISGRSDIDIHEMAQYDLAYIQQQSIGQNFRILLRTIPAVISGRGAY
jgi:lipopolysaccharide/colanic/teichoic acid biosynthesis glycosyltransferase